jgi:predicted transcriptional regulator of viral defense system
MKKTSVLAKAVEKVMELAPQMGGVFSYADLASIVAGGSDLYNQRMIKRLVGAEIISRVQKGFYIAKNCDLSLLAVRINERSYISMDSALAMESIIGTVPKRALSVVHTGRKRKIITPAGTINYYSIAPQFYFGFSKRPNCTNVADPEKAYIDLLYFYVKGARFIIDPFSDVHTEDLNRRKLYEYLKRYNNPKFVKFVKGLL